MRIRTYSELISFKTFEERFRYLKLDGKIGVATFGYDRIFNQMFYNSREWKSLKPSIIVRDNGCDLGIKGREFSKGERIFIHHLNPILLKDIEEVSEVLLNPEYLISTSLMTHNAIHYGDENLLMKDPIIRTQNDTCPWRR